MPPLIISDIAASLAWTARALRAGPRTKTSKSRRRSAERIETAGAGGRDMLHVPSHDDKIVDERRGGEQAVHVRHRRLRGDLAPSLSDGMIHSEYAVAEALANLCHPPVERLGGRRVAAADAGSAAPKLPDHQYAQVELLRLALTQPGDDPFVGAAPLPQLGDHIGIDEIAHKSSGRGPERGRSKSESSPTSGNARR